jgi:hypothetical protein
MPQTGLLQLQLRRQPLLLPQPLPPSQQRPQQRDLKLRACGLQTCRSCLCLTLLPQPLLRRLLCGGRRQYMPWVSRSPLRMHPSMSLSLRLKVRGGSVLSIS